jgi:VanZ family protein
MRAWLPVVLWMIAIFIGSTDVLSSAHTSRFIGPLLRWLKPDLAEQTIDTIQFVIRKCGHLSEYAVLAILSRRALHLGSGVLLRHWDWRKAMGSLTVATLYAASDEFHQSFVSTRYASVLDVLIDVAGAAVGLGLIGLVIQARTRWIENRLPGL